MGEKKIIQSFFVVCFSTAIVAIGTRQLHDRWIKKTPRNEKNQAAARQLIEELKGDVDPMRASLSRKALIDEKAQQQADGAKAASAPASRTLPVDGIIKKLVP